MMKNSILLGLGPLMVPIPGALWQKRVSSSARHLQASLGFMSPEHHAVRDCVVAELPRVSEALSPELVAEQVRLPLARVNGILEDLEKHMTFLFRNEQGAVAWAYPVTVDQTPHAVTFSTGESIFAA